MNKQPTVIDLFAGCGGMSWGLHQAGFQILAGVDHDHHALTTFRHNHPHAHAILADLTELSPQGLLERVGLERGVLDCLVGGPPCQGFSKNVPAAERFFDDPRNHLFRDFLHFVQQLQPKIVVIENVAEIFNAYSGRVRDEIITSLAQLGYQTQAKVIYAPDYGIPQQRRRCFLLRHD